MRRPSGTSGNRRGWRNDRRQAQANKTLEERLSRLIGMLQLAPWLTHSPKPASAS